MFNSGRDIYDIERDFCDKILDQCYQKGLEIMNVNINSNIYSIWYNYTLSTINEVAQKINNNLLATTFTKSHSLTNRDLIEAISNNLRVLNTIRSDVFKYYMKIQANNNASKTYSSYINGHNTIVPSFNYNAYVNPYITPNAQELQYLQPSYAKSSYVNYYNEITSVLTNNYNFNDEIILNLINATGNTYTKNSFITLPIGVAKLIADSSIEFLVSKLKDEYPNNATAHLIIDGLKELVKEKIKHIIDDWYLNKTYQY